MNLYPSRLHVIDSLRGFAIVSIMLLHNLEHFDFYYTVDNLPGWMQSLDKIIWDSLFFLFSGKSYAIFALLFGLTFFIQSNNQEKKGNDFRGRFAWRLVLLLVFGTINSAFYQGDILTIYAMLGFFLIPVAKLSNKTVFWIALILMLQPYEWFNFIYALNHPEIVVSDPRSWSYFGKMGEYVTGDSLFKTIVGNLTNGKIAVYLWSWENGRVFQTISLFMFGMLAGRTSLFVLSKDNKTVWIKLFLASVIAFVPLYLLKSRIVEWVPNRALHTPLAAIETSWNNMAFMMVLISGFVLLYQTNAFHRVLNAFSPIGRMSLSNYIIQSLIGAFIYYGFGLGLYKYTGATYCLLIGIVLAFAQGWFSKYWLKNHTHGPLEGIWHKATWIGTKK
jgi:uncharacterized protein